MRFITRFCANRLPAHLADPASYHGGCVRGWFVRALLPVLVALLSIAVLTTQAIAGNVRKQELQAVYSDGALYLTAKLHIQLGTEVEDALKKGIPLYFVSHAKLVRKRWYWYDADVVNRYRITRLSYVPLTRQWQVRSVDTNDDQLNRRKAFAGSLHLRFSSLHEALAAVQSFTNWKIATLAADELDGSQYVAFDFKMDLSELPKPFQLGVGNGGVWDVAYQGTAWPEHQASTDLTAGQPVGVVAEPVEIRERSQGTALHRQRNTGSVSVFTPITPATQTPATTTPTATQQPSPTPTTQQQPSPNPPPATPASTGNALP